VNRDSGTASANGGWLRLVRPLAVFQSKPHKIKRRNDGSALARRVKPARAKTIRTIGNLLIEMLLSEIIASQTSSVKIKKRGSGLTKKAEPPAICGVNRDSGTASANAGWLRRLVRRRTSHITNSSW
jgi:hypothetical protein